MGSGTWCLFRTLDISMLKAGLNTKAYFGKGRFQPFIGAGVSMTRASLSFDRQNFMTLCILE